jgi:hypothetical protein
MASLQVIDGNSRVVRYELGPESLTFGWGPDNRLVVADGSAARLAFRVARSAGVFAFQNLDARGTLRLNGRTASGGELRHADALSDGVGTVIFCAGDEEPAPPPLTLDFQPDPPQLSGMQKLLWFLTALGRARHALLKAFESPDDSDRVVKAERASTALLGRRKLSGDASQVSVDLLVFLCWQATTRGMLATAERCLDLLARRFPNALDRLALRLDLVKASWQAAEMRGFAKQAKALVADKAATTAQWVAVAADLIGRAYSRVSAACAREVIASANLKIKGNPQIQAMLAICECPASYPSLLDAQKWVKRLTPDALVGFPVMRADTCLALAAAAEWEGDWQKMTGWALEALRAAPCHRPVLYWLCRARLHIPEGKAAEHIGLPWPDKPEWSRLRLAVELHQRPSIKTAAPLAAVLDGLTRKEETPEQKLVVNLLEWTLRGQEPTDAAELTTVERISRAIEGRAGELPWTQLHIARYEVLAQRRYRDACNRLERKATASEPGAADWAAVARIMAGDKLGSVASASKPVQTLAGALDRISGNSPAIAVESRQLDEVLRGSTLAKFPCLSAVVPTVALALKVLDGLKANDIELEVCRPVDSTEPWVRWLYARTLLLLERGGVKPWIGLRLPLKDPCVAWAVELWACSQRQSRASLAESLTPVSALLDGWIAAKPADRRVLGLLRSARLGNYSFVETPSSAAAPKSVFPELGERWDELCSSDVSFELDYAVARRRRVQGDPAEAARLLRELDSNLKAATGINAVWWRPLVRYWQGAAETNAGDPAAATTFESLVDGPLDGEARSQLALLELGAGRTEQAKRWLAWAGPDLPAIRYARALVFARHGLLEQLREQLDSPAGRKVLEGSPYEIPAKRLMAATLDRLGQEAEAERLRTEFLKAHPQDEITVARQNRRSLRRAYEKAKAGEAPGEVADAVDIVLAPERGFAWRWHLYSVMRQMLTGSPEQLRGTDAALAGLPPDGATLAAWRQVLANRLLYRGDARSALELTKSINYSAASEQLRRTKAILFSWDLLTRSWSFQESAAIGLAAECDERLQRVGSGQPDPVLEYWQQLAGRALSMAGDSQGTEHLGPWAEFDSQPFGKVPGLWAAEVEIRQQCAASLAADIAAGKGGFSEEQLLLLKSLIAWVRGEDEVYLGNYVYLEPVLDELPLSGPRLWMVSGLIRFARKDWRGILEGALPDCVADLANDDVRLLIGLAYARFAAEECLKGDMRSALQNVRKAQDNLGALIEA